MAAKSCLENPLLLWKARSCRSNISQGTEGLWEHGAGVGLGLSEPELLLGAADLVLQGRGGSQTPLTTSQS